LAYNKKKANKSKLKAVVWELQGYSCGANRKPLPKIHEKWLRISARTASLQISGLKCLFLVLVSSRNHTSRCTALRLRVAFVARNRRGGIRFCVFVSFAALALFTFGYFQPTVDGWCPHSSTLHTFANDLRLNGLYFVLITWLAGHFVNQFRQCPEC